MICLLDTHILLWSLTDSPALSKKARDLILCEKNTICYSILSLWEIELKHALRPVEIPFTAKDISGLCKEAGINLLPLEEDSIFRLSSLRRPETAPPHKDPFDRMLICQAVSKNIFFLTHDAKLRDYGLKNIIEV